jgi:putative two-component system response regulator
VKVTASGHDPYPAPAWEPKLLVVDDEPANVLLLRRLLLHAGYRTVAGETVPQAGLARYLAHPPDLLLLDLHMPGMDGFLFLERVAELRRVQSFLPVVVLTADPAPGTRARALAVGASDFLAKPFDAVEVVLRIRNLLEVRRLHLQLREENRELEDRVRERTAEIERAQLEMLERLGHTAELYDDETGQHTQRVGRSAAAIGSALGLPAATVSLLRSTAPLHDLGKLAVPTAILQKPGRLTAGERAVVQRHTRAGARILAGGRCEAVQMAERIALSHHERWDGAGYPEGLREQEIPLAARIVAVADVHDALAHDRPYRRALPREEVVREIGAGAGTLFDPRVVEAFLDLGADAL